MKHGDIWGITPKKDDSALFKKLVAIRDDLHSLGKALWLG